MNFMKYKYEKSSMVSFKISWSIDTPLFTGVIVSRWSHSHGNVYQISCLERGMQQFTIEEELIVAVL